MSVEKLELKHYTPYLPYELKVIPNESIVNEFWVNKKVSLNGFKVMDLQKNRLIFNHKDLISENNKFGILTFWIQDCKMILRPLSDLLNHDLDWWIDLGEEMGTMHTDSIVDSIINETHYAMDYKRWNKLNNFLYKNHFDIDDLIGKGLAIDINTLKS